MDKYNDSFLIIGPMGVGKSLFSQALAKRLHIPILSMDQIKGSIEEREDFHKWNFWNTNTDEAGESFRDNEEYYSYYRVQRLLSKIYKPCIIDFAGNDFAYKNDFFFEQAKQLIKNYKNIIYLKFPKDITNNLRALSLQKVNSQLPQSRFEQLANITVEMDIYEKSEFDIGYDETNDYHQYTNISYDKLHDLVEDVIECSKANIPDVTICINPANYKDGKRISNSPTKSNDNDDEKEIL